MYLIYQLSLFSTLFENWLVENNDISHIQKDVGILSKKWHMYRVSYIVISTFIQGAMNNHKAHILLLQINWLHFIITKTRQVPFLFTPLFPLSLLN